MRKIILSREDTERLFDPGQRPPELEARRLATLAHADALSRQLGPLTPERLAVGILLPKPVADD